MPSLQVRELPENIYNLLQEKAKKSHRSLAGEAIVTLARGLRTSVSPKNRRTQLLKIIHKNPCIDKKILSVNPADLIREDRNR